jgi:hypothetical protein
VLSKAEAGYRAPDHRYPCMLCHRFEAYLGTCSVVAGTVRPNATWGPDTKVHFTYARPERIWNAAQDWG